LIRAATHRSPPVYVDAPAPIPGLKAVRLIEPARAVAAFALPHVKISKQPRRIAHAEYHANPFGCT